MKFQPLRDRDSGKRRKREGRKKRRKKGKKEGRKEGRRNDKCKRINKAEY